MRHNLEQNVQMISFAIGFATYPCPVAASLRRDLKPKVEQYACFRHAQLALPLTLDTRHRYSKGNGLLYISSKTPPPQVLSLLGSES